jgi:hypothetical protein
MIRVDEYMFGILNVVVEDRILEIVAELKRIATRRQDLLAELERLSATSSVAARRRQLIEEVLATGPEQTSFFFELPRSFNLMNEIRNLLGSRPNTMFSAAGIKAKLAIPPSGEKTFYAALAKLANTGQIRRAGRALYQANPGTRLKKR